MAKFTSEDLLKAMGLKVGDIVTTNFYKYKFIITESDNYLVLIDNDGDYWPFELLIKNDYTIIQPKPILTEDEKVILKNLPKYIINIYRDRAQNLFVGSNDGSYTRIYYQHMFDFIKVGDGCYSIEELLKG